MPRNSDNSSVDWEASRRAGAFVMDAPRRRPRKRIEPSGDVLMRTCRTCGAMLTDTTTDAQGRESYCAECDRELAEADVVTIDRRPEVIGAAIEKLKQARALLVICGAGSAADYVRRALKSAEGAERHAEGRRHR